VESARRPPTDPATPRDRFLGLLRAAVTGDQLAKLTLGKHRGTDATLRNLMVRPVTLKTGPHLSLVWRHDTRDITKNLPPAAALAVLEPLIGADFLDAHLFTATQHAQLECGPDKARLKVIPRAEASPDFPPLRENQAKTAAHDRARSHLIPADSPWLETLGITNGAGIVRTGQTAKFRQINKFAELLTHLLPEAFPDQPPGTPLRISDMGCGKGYLTFAVAALLGPKASVTGIEARPELVRTCNAAAAENHLTNLAFVAGRIDPQPIPDFKFRISESQDVLIALHACDTATDDAIAHGIATGARLLLLSPCCQKELRPQLTAPPVLAAALRHGIFQERQAEFVTDALRALLLEWAGYRTKVFEFISTEHTAKNLMIAAVRTGNRQATDSPVADQIRAFASFYGIRRQQLAGHLSFSLPAP
jgi:SAM-dependent methyltransferase